jgi:hypothetical protein
MIKRLNELAIIPKLPLSIGDHCIVNVLQSAGHFNLLDAIPISKGRTERFSPFQCLESVVDFVGDDRCEHWQQQRLSGSDC